MSLMDKIKKGTDEQQPKQIDEVNPDIENMLNKLREIPVDMTTPLSEPRGFRIPIKDLLSKSKQVKANEEQSEQTNATAATPKEDKEPAPKKTGNAKPVSHLAESPVDKYKKTLKDNKISEDEAINILISIFYRNKYTKQYKIIGKSITFQIPPPKYADIKFSILNEISPLYRQHEIAVNTELNIAASLKEFDGEEFPDDPPKESFMKKYEKIKNMNEYMKAAVIKKFIDFENKLYTVTQSEGVDDFFESVRSRNI